MPVINIKKEKEENRSLKDKAKLKTAANAKKGKKLPYYSRERVYERELKIIAMEESMLISSQLFQ